MVLLFKLIFEPEDFDMTTVKCLKKILPKGLLTLPGYKGITIKEKNLCGPFSSGKIKVLK
jgi:hypothetical protein